MVSLARVHYQEIHLAYLGKLFTASLFTGMKEEASKASANHTVLGGGVCDPHPLPSQVFRFAVASSSLAILSVCSAIEQKYYKIEVCEQFTPCDSNVIPSIFTKNQYENKLTHFLGVIFGL